MSRLERLAIKRLKRGDPLPIDWTTALLDRGIDVAELENKVSLQSNYPKDN